MTARVLRIFVSSPSDVAAERARVGLVADRLNAELEGRVRLDILRWEDAFYTAAHSFQEAIDAALGNMSATDMVLCIVWKRAGLKLNPGIWRRADGSAYESGTVLEFETAVEVSRKHSGIPDVYLFRKTADVLLRAERASEEMEQYQLLQAVWKRWTESAEGYNTAGYQSFGDADDFEGKLEACLRQWLERRGVTAKGPVWDRAAKGSPFRGLASFEAAHAPVFFGRETAIARATARLRHAPFLLVIGASGSGKSSLLRAGLAPRITAPGVIAEVDLWRTAIVTPSSDPLGELAQALFAEDVLGAELRAGDFSNPHLLADLFAAGSNAALAPIRGALARAARARQETLRYEAPRPAKLLIAVDQVERLFVEAAPAQVEILAGLLRALVEAGLASVIAALRSDTYGRFQTIESFLTLLNDRGATLDLLPPSVSELDDIVTRPVAACHPPLAYERNAEGRSLAEVLVADAKGGDALPLLQMTLQRLFEAEARRGDGMLRFADYPGMAAAVARTTEEAVAGLGPGALAVLPALLTAFVRDVTIDPAGGLDALTIVPVVRAQFERGDAARKALIDEFVARRLLTTEDSDGAVRVRPVHEALLRVVPAAVAIIKENAALIRVRHTLEPMVAEWSRAAADAKGDFLATSPALIAGAAQLVERFGPELFADMRTFIADSLAADAHRRDAERRRQRRVLTATAAGLVVALALAALAGWQWQVAKEQRQRAENALTAATNTANTLVFELAEEFRDRVGMPTDLVRRILDRVRDLQKHLTESGESTPALRRDEAAALAEMATTLRARGAIDDGLIAANQCREIMEELTTRDAGNAKLQLDLAECYVVVGDLQAEAGRREEALALYRKSLAIREKAVAADPANAKWRYQVAMSYQRIGGLLAIAGQREQALDAFQRALAISEKNAADDPGNPLAWEALGVSYDKVGAILATAGLREDALAAYRKGLAVFDKLAGQQPDNTLWKRHLASSYADLGSALAAGGQNEEALAAYRASVAIREKLVADDPGNAAWRRDLAASYSGVGDMLAKSGATAEALAQYQNSLAILEQLALGSPGNALLQRDLTVADNKIGDLLAATGRWDDALAAYRQGLAVRERLAAADPGNAEWQRDLAFSHDRIALALAGAGRYEEALADARIAAAIVEKLAAADPGNADWQNVLSANYGRTGGLLMVLHRPAEALESYRKKLAIFRKLAATDPTNPLLQHELWASYYSVADALRDLKRLDEARASYRDGLAVIEKLAASDASASHWQLELVGNLFLLAQLGDDPVARLTQAVAILKKLEAEGRLPADKKDWIAAFEQALASAQK